MTFYLSPQQAAALKKLKEQALALGLSISLKDDFSKWVSQQFGQLEKDLKSLTKKGGAHG
jgi:hypothetical protein